jgi:hypothetical protein
MPVEEVCLSLVAPIAFAYWELELERASEKGDQARCTEASEYGLYWFHLLEEAEALGDKL